MKLFLLSFLVFSTTIFILDYFLVGEDLYHDDIPHIVVQNSDQDYSENLGKEQLAKLASAKEQRIRDSLLESFKPAPSPKKIVFLYKPDEFSDKTGGIYKKPILSILESNIFTDKIINIVVMLYENKSTIRGNMKNKVLRLYDPDRLGVNETVAVFLHELGHYIDLYHFKEENDYDLSHEFYSISWKTTKIAHPGQAANNFVSGYASSNAYEDFSESFLYFTLHNRNFLEKAETNNVLKQKYDFFANALYTEGTFQGSDFSNSDIENYYRDITKIDFSLQNFLDYLKKSI